MKELPDYVPPDQPAAEAEFWQALAGGPPESGEPAEQPEPPEADPPD